MRVLLNAETAEIAVMRKCESYVSAVSASSAFYSFYL